MEGSVVVVVGVYCYYTPVIVLSVPRSVEDRDEDGITLVRWGAVGRLDSLELAQQKNGSYGGWCGCLTVFGWPKILCRRRGRRLVKWRARGVRQRSTRHGGDGNGQSDISLRSRRLVRGYGIIVSGGGSGEILKWDRRRKCMARKQPSPPPP